MIRATQLFLRAFVTGVVGACAVTAQAQDPASYPNKPVKIIVPFAPGGGSDFMGRLLAKQLSEKLGQPFIVENKPGAGGNLGAEIAVKSPPDGYTLMLTAASYTVNPYVYKVPFDSLKDITPIAQLARGPFIIAVNPKVTANSLKELVDLAKKQPGKLSYASAGSGSITHIASEYFMDVAGIDVVHVPYKGTSPALTDTIAGNTQIVFGTVASTIPHVKGGKLRALAVSTPKRLAALPDVPTAMELGYKDYQVTNWHGLIGPKGMSPDIVAKLNKAVNETMGAKSMEANLESDGLTASPGSAADFGAQLASESARWGAIVKKRNIKAD
ncbi:MAG: tripartite tricarboxylate transporter substrate binding protein [Burkholderiales bacterium]|nr:tripartite tricarboxylate transporter substrate binding protein [Burkholderiales bacterium]